MAHGTDKRREAVKTVLRKKRDYKKEYARDQKKRINYREELNAYNRKKGTYGNNDGLDASHRDTDGDGDKEIAGFEPQSKNRARKG